MKRITPINRTFTLRALAAAMALATANTHGAPGTLADSPLFLTNSVQPNILFVVDDSGSMDWEVQMSKGAIDAYGDGNNYGYLDFAPSNATERRALCAGYNVLAYNPNVTYTAWAGVDDAGNAYPASMSLTAARDNPYLSSGGTTDLSGQFYFVWDDANGDGVYQDGECPTPAYTTNADCPLGSSDCVRVSSLSASEQANYANWYSYYRKREYVAKRALSQLIKSSINRMGLATLHNNNSVRTLIADVDDITTPVDATAQANKNTLLDNLFNIDSSGGTPLRLILKEAGEYYKGNSSWGSSPILPAAQGGACQQNFTVLMSDGYWNGGDPSVGNQDDSPTPWAGGTYADTYEDTLADVAMKYYKEDLSALDDKVPVTTVDPQSLAGGTMHQHMVTFTAAFGVNGSLDAGPTSETGSFSWPEPVANTETTIDDMRHAAWNGRGDFLSAKDPQALIGGLDAALAAISGRVSTAAAVAFNSSALSANSELYLALFSSAKWSGNLQSYSLDAVTGAVAATPTWESGPALTNRDLDTDARTIMTWNGSDGTAFQWSNLTATQKSDFRTNSVGGTDTEAAGIARFRYVRGDRVCEQGYSGAGGNSSTASCSYSDGTNTWNSASFRPRDSRLGDIVHSAPVYVGKPSYGWSNTLPGTTPYDNYKLAQQNRAGMIYVGANDGMLHGFSESAGREVMAYVPSGVYSSASGRGLHTLSEMSYGHKFYVDLTPSVVDAFTSTTTSGTATWHTVLIGGLRAGGRGLFALDVTSPVYSESGTTPADKVMWEFNNSDDADLGYTYSNVSVVPMNNGRWAAIFGNGYNDTGSGEAQLFILYLDGGLDGTWTAGTDYLKLSTGVGDTTTRNGLSTPTVIDSNGDGVADFVYAGDLQGNMWVFDISSTSTNSWDSAYKSGSTPVPLFTTAANQPITARPIIVRNPTIPTSNANFPNTLVLFGTGQYLVPGDNTTTYSESFYGVWDHGSSQLTRSDLIAQTVGTGTTSGGVTGRTLTTNAVDYGGGDDGWYMDLPTSGERVVTNAVARGDNVYFSTMIPDSDPCTFGGTGWLMVADFVTGGAPSVPAFDLNNDGIVDGLDAISNVGAAGESAPGLPVQPSFLGNNRYTPNSGTTDGASIPQDTVEDLSIDRTGRLSWEELQR